MVYEAPTVASFKARYPEFEPVDAGLLQLVLGDAIAQVGDTWLEMDRARAQMLLTAHFLTIEGEPARSQAIASGGASGGYSGPITKRSVGDVSTEYGAAANEAASSGGMAASTAGYETTRYGRLFLDLMRKNFPAIRVA